MQILFTKLPEQLVIVLCNSQIQNLQFCVLYICFCYTSISHKMYIKTLQNNVNKPVMLY